MLRDLDIIEEMTGRSLTHGPLRVIYMRDEFDTMGDVCNYWVEEFPHIVEAITYISNSLWMFKICCWG